MLAEHHIKALKEGSAISDDVIEARGYRTITSKDELEELGFARSQCHVPGLLIPLYTTDGQNGLYVYRPDNPRVIEDRSKREPDGRYKNRVIKYEFPKGQSMRVDCPPVCQPMLANPAIPLWITEGQKKADALASLGLCAIALLGVWSWRGKNALGGTTILSDFDYIAFEGRDVRIVFDSDVMTKPEVRQALNRLTDHLHWKKATGSAVYLPPGPNGKMGVDDFIAQGHSLADLEALVEAPRPELKAAAPLVELLDAAPPVMARPIALIDGRAYLAAWLHTRVTRTESVDNKGYIVKHNPPLVDYVQKLFILRDDGTVFGEGADKSLDDLGVTLHLREIPPSDKLLSTRGVKMYRAGYRPKPVDVFCRMVSVVERFLDFERSLADQETMCEMVACYALATWFLDAFNVCGFLWPNGERGSGKTKFLTVIAELSYLGQVILAGGSYAALRDLADYGATLCFDDAENLADPKKTDPDKRALLLAGNRRGNTVAVKEISGDKTWQTRYVNTFCPRCFSAINIPDAVLASRSIIVPLLRTPDRYKANSEVLDYTTWPCERSSLLDDLWLTALANLNDLATYEMQINARSQLSGRTLEPWRMIMAVAAWLDDKDDTGALRRDGWSLWQRMENLALAYQRERPELEGGDLTTLVIQAIRCSISSISSISSITWRGTSKFELTVTNIRNKAIELVKEEEGEDAHTDWITNRRIGRVLARLRLRQLPRKGSGGSRIWEITEDELQRLEKTFALCDPLQTNGANGENGANGANLTKNIKELLEVDPELGF